ncbi:MAG: DUF6285 domain-containing protein [Stellaceae bacterium]
MRDLPDGRTLLAFARDMLLDDLLPLLPPERRLDARLIANCMAIAAREAAIGREPEQNIERELSALYETASPSLPRAGVGADRGEGPAELLHRFARDLRIGAFEISERRAAAARAILWQMTIERLRLANPRFLAANGLDGPKG